MEKKYTTQEDIEQIQKELAIQKQKRENKNSKRRKRHRAGLVRKVVGGIAFGVATLFLLVTLISIQMQKNRGEIPNLLGYQFYRVETGSMDPTLAIGSVIMSRKANGQTLKVGDIVTFRMLSGAIVTHRVVEVLRENDQITYRTKGDNPVNSPDQELLTPDRVLSVFVAKIPWT